MAALVWRRAVVATTALVAVLAVASPASGAGTRTRGLPPPDEAAIARLFNDQLRPLGLAVSRASLQQPPRYTPDPKGRHLAVYVVPTGEYTGANYLRNVTAVAQVFLPHVFDRWKLLQSFDVCQEPRPSVDPRPEAPPVTQLFVTRAGEQRVRWTHVTLSRLQAATRSRGHQRDDTRLYIDTPLLGEPAYNPSTPTDP